MRRIPAMAYATVALVLAWAIFDVRGFGLVDDHILYADMYWTKHFYLPHNLGLGRFFPANGLEFSLLRKAGAMAPWVFRTVAAMKFALAAWLLFSAFGRGGFRGWGRTALGLLVVLTPAMACASQRLFVSELNLFIGLLLACRFWPESGPNDRPARRFVQLGMTTSEKCDAVPRERALAQVGLVVLCAALCFYKETVAPMLLAAGGVGLAIPLWRGWRRRKMTPNSSNAESESGNSYITARAGSDSCGVVSDGRGGFDAGDRGEPGRGQPTDESPAINAGPVWFHLALVAVGAAYLAGYALFVLPHKVQSGYLALQAKDSPPWALARYVMNDPALFAGLLAWGLGLVRRARKGLAFEADAALFAAALAVVGQYVALGLFSPYYLLPAYALAASRLRPQDLGWTGAQEAEYGKTATYPPSEYTRLPAASTLAGLDLANALTPAEKMQQARAERKKTAVPRVLPRADSRRPLSRTARVTRTVLAGVGAVLLLGSLAGWAYQFSYLYYSQKNLADLEGFLTRLAATRTDRPVRLFTPQATPRDEATLALVRLVTHLGLLADIDFDSDVAPGPVVRPTYPAGAAADDAVLLTPLVRLADWETWRMERGLPVLFATRSPLFVPDYSLEGFWLKWPGSHMSLAELDRRRTTFRPDFVVLAPRGGDAFTPFDLVGLDLRVLKAPERARPWTEAELTVEVTNNTPRTWLAPPDDEGGGVVLAALYMRPDAEPRQIGRAFLPSRLEPGQRARVHLPFRMPLGRDLKVIGTVIGRLTENGLALTPGGAAPYVLVREDWGAAFAP